MPQLPGKSFTIFAPTADPKTLDKRRAAFASLLAHIAQYEALACSDATVAFFSDVARPDIGKVHATALQRMLQGAPRRVCVLAGSARGRVTSRCGAAVLALPPHGWEARYDKNGVRICVQRVASSHLYLLRSTISVPLPVERTHAHYTVRGSPRMLLHVAPETCMRGAPPTAHAQLEAVDARRDVR